MLNQLTARATGLQVLTGSTESATVGNFAIQLAALEGKYTNDVGVTANAVAEWAAILSAPPDRCPGKHRSLSTESKRFKGPTGKALA